MIADKRFSVPSADDRSLMAAATAVCPCGRPSRCPTEHSFDLIGSSVHEVDYFEAWTRWFAVDESLRTATLWGVKIVWWARFGKVLAFFAGMVLLIDIIGPERITERYKQRFRFMDDLSHETGNADKAYTFGRNLALWSMAGLAVVMAFVQLVLSASAGLTVTVIALLLITLSIFGMPLLVRLAYQGKFVVLLRCASLFLFITGFHFDLLGS